MFTQTRRMLATTIAIVLGVAFLTITLCLSGALKATFEQSARQSVGSADLIITAKDRGKLPLTATDDITKIAGVQDVRSIMMTTAEQLLSTREQFTILTTLPKLSAHTTLISGRMPNAAGEVVVSRVIAEGRSVKVGDQVTLRSMGQKGAKETKFTAVGVISAGSDAIEPAQLPAVFAANDDIHAFDPEATFAKITITAPNDVAAVRKSVSTLSWAAGTRINDRATELSYQLDQRGKDAAMMTMLLSSFAVIALVVVAMVIGNTFAIIVAQQRREFGLMACVGATPAQIFRNVLRNSLIVGLIGSALGICLGIGIGYLGLTLMQSPTFTLQPFAITPALIGIPVLVGTLMTVVSAIVPARAATRVSPMAALRPADVGANAQRVSRLKTVAGLVLTVAGGAGLAYAATAHSVPVGLASGVVSFVGVLFLAPVLVPTLATVLGKALGSNRSGTTQLAVANATRNPGRSAVTTAALLVGVTLIVMTMTAMATASRSISEALDSRYPVDATVTASTTLTDDNLATLKGDPRIDRIASIYSAPISVAAAGKTRTGETLGLTPDAITTPRSAAFTKGLTDDTVVVSASAGLTNGDTATLSANGKSVTKRVVVSESNTPTMVTERVMRELVPDAKRAAWVQYRGGVDSAVAGEQLATKLSQEGARVEGPASARADLDNQIRTVTSVVLGLLAVSVIIALVGVGNTMMLSVAERRAETGLLSALGVTPAGVRSLVSREGLILAVVGTVIGVALGVAYGISGAAALIGEQGTVRVDVPWLQLVGVVVVSVVAGWLATAVPARNASRLSPMEALSTT